MAELKRRKFILRECELDRGGECRRAVQSRRLRRALNRSVLATDKLSTNTLWRHDPLLRYTDRRQKDKSKCGLLEASRSLRKLPYLSLLPAPDQVYLSTNYYLC